MDKIKIEQVIRAAHDYGIDVIWAKCKEDIGFEGVHLQEPTVLQVVEGLNTALLHGVKLVVIHSKVTLRGP